MSRIAMLDLGAWRTGRSIAVDYGSHNERDRVLSAVGLMVVP